MHWCWKQSGKQEQGSPPCLGQTEHCTLHHPPGATSLRSGVLIETRRINRSGRESDTGETKPGGQRDMAPPGRPGAGE